MQKFKDAILLIAFANAIFQCFEIIALPGCGISVTSLFFIKLD